ncbi:phosphatidate cytidylyltransferase [Sulfuricystis multivorans]|uniref:phosphatidate cytidylyltransferase n=1 Tax=Sulfuricystis multivorans TaxID=2211108 RepID=UPI000F824C99|nr:phosphatidate cytidylyltransferase [Sulfuricystis multivorans]
MLKARIITALFLVAAFLAVLFLLPPRLAGMTFALVAAMAAWEWAGLMQAPLRGRIAFGLLAFGLCLLFWTRPEDGFRLLWGLATLFWLGVAPLWLKWQWPTACATLGLVLILPAWAALVALHARSPVLLLAVMALVWVADIAAYFSGRAFGRHKLAPSISPGKTWEGVAGALIGVLVYGFAVAPLLPAVQNLDRFVLAGCLLIITALSIVGDLFESLAKRQAGVKDSSQLLPGHGGILDRIDSQLSTLPLVALGLHFLSA